MIGKIPIFPTATYNSLTTLNLRNNNLSTLEGKFILFRLYFIWLTGLEELKQLSAVDIRILVDIEASS